jgi:16S rRNA (guanine527-N7)-methyltransferase
MLNGQVGLRVAGATCGQCAAAPRTPDRARLDRAVASRHAAACSCAAEHRRSSVGAGGSPCLPRKKRPAVGYAAIRVLRSAFSAPLAMARRAPYSRAERDGRQSASRCSRRRAAGRFTFYGRAVAPPSVHTRLSALSARFALPGGAVDQLEALLELVATEPTAITSVRDPLQGVDVHVADSLVALDVEAVRHARRIADIGSGGGFPGLVLAIALPTARVALIESVGRKCAFLERAARTLELGNVEVVRGRAESWRAGLGAHDLVTARAVASLGVLIEYAAPLLDIGGALLSWKGRRDAAEEADAASAADALGMAPPEPHHVEPFRGGNERRLYLSLKVRSTPNGFPRREGMARKRPFRAST